MFQILRSFFEKKIALGDRLLKVFLFLRSLISGDYSLAIAKAKFIIFDDCYSPDSDRQIAGFSNTKTMMIMRL